MSSVSSFSVILPFVVPTSSPPWRRCPTIGEQPWSKVQAIVNPYRLDALLDLAGVVRDDAFVQGRTLASPLLESLRQNHAYAGDRAVGDHHLTRDAFAREAAPGLLNADGERFGSRRPTWAIHLPGGRSFPHLCAFQR